MKTEPALEIGYRIQTDVREMPRERLIRMGAGYLTDGELLEILIGWGTKEKPVNRLADEVLRLIDRLNGETSVRDLMNIKGMGEAKAAAIAAALEFSRRKLCADRGKIRFPSDAIPFINHFADRNQEHFLTVSLNGAHEVIAVRVVSVGLVNKTMVHPREVFADPLVDRAVSLIVAHNHPSGNVQPSPEDREITRRLMTAGEMLGIALLDHIIFGKKGYYSFQESGDI